MAMGILLGCIVVLTRLAAIGRANADDADQTAKAQLVCQTRLSEMVAGITPVMPAQDRPLEADPGWKYSVRIEPLDELGLVALHVAVSQDVPEGQRARRFALVRWIRDPQGRLAAISAAVEETSDADETSDQDEIEDQPGED